MEQPPLPPRPREPDPYECCGRHCDPCIFDYYRIALDRWTARMRELGVDVSDDG